ncbi:MAG: hypothetical protein HZA08_11050 [Nitrospirae bacterium]|nr:hypothetical protein [Nitrospirota bacterium]
MKKLILIITIAMVFAFSNMAMAEQPHVSVGLKTWAATWDTKLDTGSGNKDFSSDYGLMLGPSVNVQYDKYFAGASYLFGTFSFPAVSVAATDINLDADRTDMDISAGYYFHPNVAAFLGYKLMDLKYKMKLDPCVLGVCGDTSKETRNGPVLGVTGHYPIEGSRWVLFGNLSYVFLNSEFKDSSGNKDTSKVTGPAVEFGGAYTLENMPLSLLVGLKYQNYEYDTAGAANDTFSGLTFGVNYPIQ